ncbi:MAG TPA: hypothetical protein C5S50_07370 [Methanosarcinaceae archaeon]|nr:hypothetical protein [Methanosarcinaceae archaeon]
MEQNQCQKLIFRISLILCIVSLLLTLVLGHTYLNSSSNMLEDAKRHAEDQARNETNKIDTNLCSLILISESIANDLSSGKLEDEQIDERLKGTLGDHTKLWGSFVAYKPYEYNSSTRLYVPYFIRCRNGSIQRIQVEYDYTLPDEKNGIRTNWYHQTLIKGSCWIEPYFGAAGQTLMVNYNVPFYSTNASGKKVLAGVVGTEYSLDGIRDQVGSLNLGDTGYGFILTGKGTVVSHPIQEYLGKNITELQKADKTLRAITQNITYDEHQVIHNEITGQDSWVFYESIPSTNWTLGVVFIDDEVFEESRTVQHHLMILFAMSVIAFLFLLSILVFRVYKGSSASLWIIVMIFSILCLSGMGFIWHLTLEDSPASDQRTVEVFDRTGLEVALHKLQGNRKEPLIRVPTGLFLQSLEFSSANNVIVTGYIWQDYSGIVGEISKGFIFPEAESVDIKEAYRNDDVIGWYFKAVLRQPFDYSKYPFDHENVWIRLWHKDFHRNIILTPDIGSYEVINPDMKPGLERDFVLEGWEVQNSFFGYRENRYNTNFGVEDYQHESPELYFNVGMKRDFLGSIVSDLIRLIVVSILLFAVLLISTKNDENIGLYGFSSSAVLTYCAALFFVLIISHVSLRDKLAVAGIIYLEYLYFVLYFVLLVVSINSILLASSTNHKLIHYRDNLIVKLLYWPVVLGMLLIITLINFY